MPELGTPPPPPLARLARLIADPDAPPVRLTADGYDDMWAPIVTSVRPAAVAMSSEPGGAAPRREVVGLARVGLSLTPAREQLAEVLRTGAYLAAFLAMLGALAALLIARRISDPILALAAGADAIRAGNLDVEIAVGSEDEIGLLAASFNAMAAELRETLTKLESLNRNLEAEVLRRTDEIRRSAEFTAVLNAAHEGEELKRLLEDALATLMAATEVRAAAILLTNEEALEFELHFAAHRGDEAPPLSFGAMPSHTALATGEPIVEPTRAIVPVLFRGQPEGAHHPRRADARARSTSPRVPPGSSPSPCPTRAPTTRPAPGARADRAQRGAGQAARSTAGDEPAQVRVPGQRLARAAHAAQRHPRLHRAHPRGDLRRRPPASSARRSKASRSRRATS